MFCCLVLSCDIGVDKKDLRAERASEFLVLIASIPEIKTPSSFSGWTITIYRERRDVTQDRSTVLARSVLCGQETASDAIYWCCSIPHHDYKSYCILIPESMNHNSLEHIMTIDDKFRIFLSL